jgi:hypothetical protein
MKKANGTPGECPSEPLNHGEHWRHQVLAIDMLWADVVRCNQYKKGVDGYT